MKQNPFEEKFPLLFRNKDEMEPINLFGIECRKGWDDLLNTTFLALYSKYKSRKYSLDFWKTLEPDEHYSLEKIQEMICKLEAELKEEEDKLPIVVQCKEKFGTLRLYCDNVNDYSRGVIDLAEALSGLICEVCGNSGKTSSARPRGWVSTLCVECTEKRDSRLTSHESVVESSTVNK